MIFVTGTNTDVGKTLISTWLCVHTKWQYWKPVQTGINASTESRVYGEYPLSDSEYVQRIANVPIVPEAYSFEKPCSPHEASLAENIYIDISELYLPTQPSIIEGAGGICVPLNEKNLYIDIMEQWKIPTLIVSTAQLGTINHSILTAKALQEKDIPLLGFIINGEYNPHTHRAIEHYTNVPIICYFPHLSVIEYTTVQAISLPRIIEEYIEKYTTITNKGA